MNIRNVVTRASVIRGVGFDEIIIDAIQELVEGDKINEADLVAMTNEALLIADSSDDLSGAEIKVFTKKCGKNFKSGEGVAVVCFGKRSSKSRNVQKKS